jgi:threonine dehydrogenase-like Zn-dependent dehydrogenase
MLRPLNIFAGKRIGIGGLGPAGLIAAQMARAEGASEVVGFDLSATRRDYACTHFFDAAYDPRDPALSETIPVRPTAPKLDSAVDCVGAKASVEFLMDRVRDVVALFGVQREDYVFKPRHNSLRLCGYPGHSRAAAEYAVDLMERGCLNLAPLVTHHLPLERYAEGIDLLERQEAIKVCFHPWADGASK